LEKKIPHKNAPAFDGEKISRTSTYDPGTRVPNSAAAKTYVWDRQIVPSGVPCEDPVRNNIATTLKKYCWHTYVS